MPDAASPIPRAELSVPGAPELKLIVYGAAKAGGLRESMEQAYFVAVEGAPTPRADLSPSQNIAIRELLIQNYPEHACI